MLPKHQDLFDRMAQASDPDGSLELALLVLAKELGVDLADGLALPRVREILLEASRRAHLSGPDRLNLSGEAMQRWPRIKLLLAEVGWIQKPDVHEGKWEIHIHSPDITHIPCEKCGGVAHWNVWSADMHWTPWLCDACFPPQLAAKCMLSQLP